MATKTVDGALATAAAFYRAQRALVRRIAAEAAREWRKLDSRFLDHSWHTGVGPRLLSIVSAGQLLAASSADGYLDRILAAEGLDTASEGATLARAIAGVASDGRPLDSLLYQAVVATKAGIGHGLTSNQAMQSGLFSLDLITRTQVQDAGRTGTSVATAARPQVNGYVRMLNPPSCSRCVILAGRWYRWNTGFQRHPQCDCIMIPAAENISGDLATNPKLYFDSLDETAQDKAFTKAGAEAVRLGADLSKVVNARRGMYTAAGRRLTHEGAGRRVRLMPEQILKEAGGNRAEAIRLLKRFGYLS